MAYYNEETIKVNLISKINKVAKKLKIYVELPPLEYTTYADLDSCHKELLGELQAKQFDQNKSLQETPP